MRRSWCVAAFGLAALIGWLVVLNVVAETQTKKAGPMIGHMVYFKLKDSSAAEKKKLVDLCKKHLSKHDGVVYFSAGVLAEEFKREVNDVSWDVALHLVFKDKAAHDVYQDHPRHKEFIDGGKANWDKVRVFDSLVEAD